MSCTFETVRIIIRHDDKSIHINVSRRMAFGGAHIIPLTLFLLLPATIIGNYIAAVMLGHVKPSFPYISQVGNNSPESCYFAQFVNIAAVLTLLVVYIRYCQILEYYNQFAISQRIVVLNKVGLATGIISSIGLSMIANFQATNVMAVHFAGAILCFGFGNIFLWVQTTCTYYLSPFATSLMMAHIRVVLATVSTLSLIISFITHLLAASQFHGDNPLKWGPEDGGWALHIASSATEWILAGFFCLYCLSFYSEFQVMTFSHPKVFLNIHEMLINPGEDIVS